jgi:hypothetical protein
VRDRWYGDDRDILKWETLVALTEQHSNINLIIQVTYRTKSKKDLILRIAAQQSAIRVLKPHFTELVTNFFQKDIARINELEAQRLEYVRRSILTNPEVEIELFDRACGGGELSDEQEPSAYTKPYRQAYTDQVEMRVMSPYLREKHPNVILFLDPDTGIERRKGFDALSGLDMEILAERDRKLEEARNRRAMAGRATRPVA